MFPSLHCINVDNCKLPLLPPITLKTEYSYTYSNLLADQASSRNQSEYGLPNEVAFSP